MKIRNVEFLISVVAPGAAAPDTLPQVAFSGRSNVGKSSLINSLLRRTRKKIAKVSSTPGKTQTLNFYRVNDAFLLVDLPGFGYAKAPQAVRDSWKLLVERYLAGEKALKGVVHLVDCRHDPSPGDLAMLDHLASLGVPTLVVLTKVDKLTHSRRERIAEERGSQLGVDPEQLLPYSSVTGTGRETLLAALGELIGIEEESGA